MLLYRKFLGDFLRDSDPDIFEQCADLFSEDAEEFDDEYDEATGTQQVGTKKKAYKENYYFAEHLQKPYVTSVLEKRKNRDAIVMFTGKFIDDHSRQLSTSGPVYSFTFGKKETSFLYELFNISKEKILEIYNGVVESTYYGSISQFITGWITHAPHKLLICAILIDSMQHNYSDLVECCEYLWAFTEYPILYSRYWSTGVTEEVMNYTIEHLGSKHKVKQGSTLKELLKYDTEHAVDFFADKLKTGVDNTYIDLMRSIRTRMNSKFKNISSAYYANKRDNAAMHKNAAQFDDGEIVDQEGYSTNVAKAVEVTISKFSTNEVNAPLARIAADYSKVDKDNLMGYISQINSASGNRLNKFIECVITAYFDKNPASTSLGSGEFLNFGLALYKSIGTSKNQILKEIRSILDLWMFDIIDIRSQYQREATVINYTKAIFNYMVMMINHYN